MQEKEQQKQIKGRCITALGDEDFPLSDKIRLDPKKPNYAHQLFTLILSELPHKEVDQLTLDDRVYPPQVFHMLPENGFKFPIIKCLSLSNCCINNESCRQIAQHCQWPTLKMLDLSCNQIEAQGMKHIMNGSWKKLIFLDVAYNSIGNDGAAIVGSTKFPINLLNISHNMITWQGMKSFSKGSLKTLISLRLWGNPIGDKGFHYLCINSDWKKLQLLELCDTGLTNKGIKSISHAYWPSLKTLNFAQNKRVNQFSSLQLLRVSSMMELFDIPGDEGKIRELFLKCGFAMLEKKNSYTYQ